MGEICPLVPIEQDARCYSNTIIKFLLSSLETRAAIHAIQQRARENKRPLANCWKWNLQFGQNKHLHYMHARIYIGNHVSYWTSTFLTSGWKDAPNVSTGTASEWATIENVCSRYKCNLVRGVNTRVNIKVCVRCQRHWYNFCLFKTRMKVRN